MKKVFFAGHRFLKKYHIIKSIVAISLFLMVLFSSYLLYLAKTTDVNELKVSLSHQTVLLDDTQKEVGRLTTQKGTYVELEHISPHLIDAIITTEDQRFFEHRGFDIIGIGRAMLSFIKNGFSTVGGGGSTLTQQLAKNAYLTQKQTFVRKFQELFLALEIEKQYSKNDILTMYLNHAYFGNGVWGVEDASQKYFGKSAKQLSISESAVLAGMLKGPSIYNPYDDMISAKNRRNTVLELLKNENKITLDEYAFAINSDIQVKDTYNVKSHYQYPYFFDAVIDEVQEVYGISEDDLFNKGYKIYTTLNTAFQDVLEKTAANNDLFPNRTETLVQTAAIVSDPKTGEIKGLIGGRGKHVYRGFNRAYQMYRQPGSLLKPLVVYTPALESGYTPRSVLLDEVKSYGTDNYTPYNWDYKTLGNLPMYQALALSKNTSAVWLLNEIGLDKGLEKLKLFGIAVDKEDSYLGIALGGMTKGTTLKAINEAYGTFANDGVRLEQYFITKIEDASGQVIAQKTYTNRHNVMSEETAKAMTQMMMGVYEEGGTAPFQKYNNLQLAGKTGTTESTVDSSDMWASAYTKDFVYTTWIGYDTTTQEDYLRMSQGDSIKPLFNATVNGLLQHSKQTAFGYTSTRAMVAQEVYDKEQQEKSKQSQDWFGNLTNRLQETFDSTINRIQDFFSGFFR